MGFWECIETRHTRLAQSPKHLKVEDEPHIEALCIPKILPAISQKRRQRSHKRTKKVPKAQKTEPKKQENKDQLLKLTKKQAEKSTQKNKEERGS